MLCKDKILQHLKDAGLLSNKQHASMLVPSQVQHLGKVYVDPLPPSQQALNYSTVLQGNLSPSGPSYKGLRTVQVIAKEKPRRH